MTITSMTPRPRLGRGWPPGDDLVFDLCRLSHVLQAAVPVSSRCSRWSTGSTTRTPRLTPAPAGPGRRRVLQLQALHVICPYILPRQVGSTSPPDAACRAGAPPQRAPDRQAELTTALGRFGPRGQASTALTAGQQGHRHPGPPAPFMERPSAPVAATPASASRPGSSAAAAPAPPSPWSPRPVVAGARPCSS